MDITIIIDKSAFQSLSFDELYRLSTYYKHVITPVLTMEILGDLKKETKEGKTPSHERVKDFAQKLFPNDTVVNLHYKILVKGDLLGNPVSMDRRPNVGMSKAVMSDTGQRGFLVEESSEEKSIYKWKQGYFTEADKELSSLWRVTTTNDEVLSKLKDALNTTSKLNFKNFNELRTFSYDHITDAQKQEKLLYAILQNYEIDTLSSFQILARWYRSGKPLLREFAPYAFHCLNADTLFLFGLASGLISTRPTNKVDLEYLYYLPFAWIFTSNDKVQIDLASLMLSKDQRFIRGTELKHDLKVIVEYLEAMEPEERRMYKSKPPILEDSLTFQLWKEYFGYPTKSNWNRDLSEEEKSMMKEKMKEFEKALNGDDIELKGDTDAEFIVRKSYLSKNDPCHCGSGRQLIECCLPEIEFDKLMQIQIEKGINSKASEDALIIAAVNFKKTVDPSALGGLE